MMNNESTFMQEACSADSHAITSLMVEQENSSFSFWSAISLVSLSLLFFLRVLTRSRVNKHDSRVEAQRKRKKYFTEKAGDSYGYANSAKGHIDTWRSLDFPHLVEPLVQTTRKARLADQRMIYLDYAGAALPTKSQLTAILTDNTVLANPHSTGPAASKTSLLIEQATKRVAQHFNCEPGRFAGLKNVPESYDPREMHPGYDIVFTSGATEALRIVAERFPWTPTCQICGEVSTFTYAKSSHTSVVGMRGPALASGAKFECKSLRDICNGTEEESPNRSEKGLKCQCQHRKLLVVSAECNFGGERPAVASIVHQYRKRLVHTMIDYSKAASTSVVDLKESDPDFACLSFYKLFGEPTGLGALFVRRSAITTLMRDHEKPRYFGGGSVDVILPSIDFKVSREQPSLLASLKDGTAHYRGIASLTHGFDELQSLGGMVSIKSHSTALASEFVSRLRLLRHGNGKAAIVVYGAWSRDDDRDKGPTVAFNCLRSDGTFVGYNEVSKLAELHEPPMQLRTGCFCNPGACQEALGLKDEDIQTNYYTNGHVCGDHIDVVKGTPTGAIRASFGKDSLWEDLDCLASFLEDSFVNAHLTGTEGEAKHLGEESVRAVVTELYIFPIKSCAAQQVTSWSLDKESGRLMYDREFALVDSSGTAMRLQRYPKMSQIRPRLDLEAMTLIVSAPGCGDLVLELKDERCDVKPNGVIQVCGNKCGGRLWGSYESSRWFSRYLGVQCWLARHSNDNESLVIQQPSRTAFANEEAILLISENAVDRLNLVLERQGQKHAQTKHFRPNIVVSSQTENSSSESSWKVVEHGDGNLTFETAGDCARCSMVDVDPTTGIKGKTLRALADHNRRDGRITFGIFLRQVGLPRSCDNMISQGDILFCK